MTGGLRPNSARQSLWCQVFLRHGSRLLSCIGRNLFEAEVGPIHCYLLPCLFCRIEAEPGGNTSTWTGGVSVAVVAEDYSEEHSTERSSHSTF